MQGMQGMQEIHGGAGSWAREFHANGAAAAGSNGWAGEYHTQHAMQAAWETPAPVNGR